MTRTIVFIHGAWATQTAGPARAAAPHRRRKGPDRARRDQPPELKTYAKSPAQTDFRMFPDRTHWIIAQNGWQELAEHISRGLHAVCPPTP